MKYIKDIKLDNKKLQRIKEVEMDHYIRQYHKAGAKKKHDLPDYLRPFVEPQTTRDLKKVAKSILDNTFDLQKEEDWLNTIVYRHLPLHEKANFRAKCLKHISLDILEEKEAKMKIKAEKMAKLQKIKEE